VPLLHIHILSPLFGLLTNVVVQVWRCRHGKNRGLLRSVFEGFISGYATVLAIEVAYCVSTKADVVECVGQMTLSTITYVVLGYGYFHFINLGETARRVRILRELWESQDGLSVDELLMRYNASEIFSIRLRRMINNEQLELRNGRYYIGNPVMLYMAKAMMMMKLILLKKRGEFEQQL
jgi:hypothetical protein